jgi:hypothetical protein
VAHHNDAALPKRPASAEHRKGHLVMEARLLVALDGNLSARSASPPLAGSHRWCRDQLRGDGVGPAESGTAGAYLASDATRTPTCQSWLPWISAMVLLGLGAEYKSRLPGQPGNGSHSPGNGDGQCPKRGISGSSQPDAVELSLIPAGQRDAVSWVRCAVPAVNWRRQNAMPLS